MAIHALFRITDLNRIIIVIVVHKHIISRYGVIPVLFLICDLPTYVIIALHCIEVGVLVGGFSVTMRVWIFTIYSFCILCTMTNGEDKRILLNDPSLMNQRLTHLESLVQSLQTTVQKQETVIQQQQSKMSTMENELMKFSNQGKTICMITKRVTKTRFFEPFGFGETLEPLYLAYMRYIVLWYKILVNKIVTEVNIKPNCCFILSMIILMFNRLNHLGYTCIQLTGRLTGSTSLANCH